MKVEAWKLREGDQIDGKIVTKVTINERNEWLTVFAEFADASTHQYTYYQKVEIQRGEG